MPCRALEAFRPWGWAAAAKAAQRLNALSGIGGVQTQGLTTEQVAEIVAGLNALSGIGGVQTHSILASEELDRLKS